MEVNYARSITTDFSRETTTVTGNVTSCDGSTVVRTIHSENFTLTATDTSHLDSVFVGVSTTVAEEYAAHAFWSMFNDSLSESCTNTNGLAWSDEAKLFCLFFDSIDDVTVTMTKVHVNELGAHVIVFLAVVIPEVDTFGFFNRDNLG